MTTRAPAVPASRYRWSALAAVTVTVLAWASAFVAIRSVGESYGAGPLALGRLLVGSLALGAGLLVSRRWVPPTGGEWTLIALCGVAWFGVYNVALNAAEQSVDAGTTAMLVNIGPSSSRCSPGSCSARGSRGGWWPGRSWRSPARCSWGRRRPVSGRPTWPACSCAWSPR